MPWSLRGAQFWDHYHTTLDYQVVQPKPSVAIACLSDVASGTTVDAYMLRGGSAVARWTCDLQVAGSIPGHSTFT